MSRLISYNLEEIKVKTWARKDAKERQVDRKTFLKKASHMSLASSCMLFFKRTNAMADTDIEHARSEQKFKEDWIVALMANLEERLDYQTRCALMEACGRDCAKRGAVTIAESCKSDVNKMVETLGRISQVEITDGNDNSFKVSYKKCFCELVSKGPERLPSTYCECSRGWLLQMFETAAQKPVAVEVIQTIKRGGTSCDFLIQI